MLVPQGWSAQGGYTRDFVSNNDPIMHYVVTDSTEQLRIYNTSPKSPQYIDTTALPEGTWYPFEGAKYNLHYMEPGEYAQNVILSEMESSYINPMLQSIEPITSTPNIQGSSWSHYSAALATYSYILDGIPYKEVIQIITKGVSDSGFSGFTSWSADVQGVSAPVNQYQSALDTYRLIVPTVTMNIYWLIEAHEGNKEKAKAVFEAQKSPGSILMRDPNTGNIYLVNGAFPFWFTDGNGNFAASKTATNPDVQAFTIMEKVNSPFRTE